MSEAQNQPTPESIQASRLPFPVEFARRAGAFTTETMREIPELAGIAIVPLWAVAPENADAGQLHLRNPRPPFIHVLIALLKRLSAFSIEVHGLLNAQLRALENSARGVEAMMAAQLDAVQAAQQSPETNPDPESSTDAPANE